MMQLLLEASEALFTSSINVISELDASNQFRDGFGFTDYDTVKLLRQVHKSYSRLCLVLIFLF